MKKLLVLLIACLALTVAACGDDDDDDGGGDGAATTTEQTDTGAAPPADEGGGGGGGEAVTVDIPAIEFDPAEVTVAAGTTITWTNSDDLPHTVTKEGGPGEDFDSGDLAPGDEFEQTFTEPGTVDYVCTIHPGQAGTVTVE
jgi:plastocyanin